LLLRPEYLIKLLLGLAERLELLRVLVGILGLMVYLQEPLLFGLAVASVLVARLVVLEAQAQQLLALSVVVMAARGVQDPLLPVLVAAAALVVMLVQAALDHLLRLGTLEQAVVVAVGALVTYHQAVVVAV
jgi:hypothetical protein